MVGKIKEKTDRSIAEESNKDKRFPSIDVAEARIHQALLKHKMMADRCTPKKDKSRVRL